MLERWIRDQSDASKGPIIALLFFFLNQWNRKNTGLHPQAVGLPQDALADCSRILANFYLQKYDGFATRLCEEAGATYFRYSDDQMILLNGLEHCDRLMLLITRALDRYGLRVNQKKVHVWTTPDLLEFRCREIQAIFSKKGDNKDKSLIRQFVDAYLAIPKEKLERTWNGGLPLLNRLLWANLESLPVRHFETLLRRYTSVEYMHTADSAKLARVAELNDQRRRPIDLTERLKSIGDTCVHNYFHYEVLAFARNTRNRVLAEYFEERITELNAIIEHRILE